MTNFKHDEEQSGVERFFQTGVPQCAECEAALADVLDGTLTAEDQAKFDRHVSTCDACARMLADAQRGAAWLEMLRTPRPEPPAALLERILAQTSGQLATVKTTLSVVDRPGEADGVDAAPRTAKVLPFRTRFTAAFQRNSIGHAMLQPRLAMTAAMAFFSIGLTLNLTGVRLNELRVSNLKPSNLRRSFYEADAHIVRYYTNLRVVYELESRVRDLQRATEVDSTSPAEPETKPSDDPKQTPRQQKDRPMPGQGTSRRQGIYRDLQTVATLQLPDATCSRISGGPTFGAASSRLRWAEAPTLHTSAFGPSMSALTQLHRTAQEGELV